METASPALKVLAVDDNRVNLQIVQVFLAKLGHQVITAENGALAVERFVAEAPDLILLDILMPVMDGFEAARRIKALCPGRWVPIIFLSALSRDENLVGGLDAGGDDYLNKPLNFVVLEAKMRSMARALHLQAQLAEARARERVTADAILDAVVSIDARGKILSCNQGAERIFQWSREELIGQPVEVLMPAPYRENHQSYLQNYLLGGPPQMIGLEREVEAIRRDGSLFPAELGVTEIHGLPDKAFVGVLRDITLRRRQEVEQQRQTTELQSALKHADTERQLLRSLVDKQMQRASLDDEVVHRWNRPSENFSGDIVAAARDRHGRLHVMLGDATGHGLAAAICALPVLAVFYRLVAQELGVAQIVSQINQELNESMPTERFVGAAIAVLDFECRRGEIWVGGIPEAMLLDAAGAFVCSFASTHLPLGVEPSERINTATTAFDLPADAQLLLSSDGLLEAEDPSGVPFTRTRLLAAAKGSGGGERLARIRAALEMHLRGQPSGDDISLLLVDCA